jgi:hypothetical protein
MAKSKDDSRRRYVTEPLARAEVLQRLAPHFEFIEEVEAINADGHALRIDAVATCRTTGWTFGWEFKKSHLFKSEFADAMRQAIHYRLSRITDARLPAHKDMQLPAVALFPDWLGEHDDDVTNYGKEAEGMRLIGDQFRVGTMRQTGDDKFAFIMGQSGAIWNSTSGWSKTAEIKLFGKRGLGSTRKKDS